ncbi:MAG TPA: PQQ-binding-like beta-propeller repeat protein [Bryobacteraceae bacterium]|nr:PQQ-binding-like beta-propeller repeat protein [Bryobacteraceae bacterium]
MTVRTQHWLFTFVASAISVAGLHAADWPMYLYDLSHSSYDSSETQIHAGNVPQLQTLWKTNVQAIVSSGITTSNGSLFFGAWDGNFYSVNAATGAVQWSTFIGVAPDAQEPGCFPGIGVAAQPIVSGNTVYASGGDSAVYALNRETGAIIWRQQLADPDGGGFLWASAVLYNNALYIGIASLGDCPAIRAGIARISLSDPTHPLIQYTEPDDGPVGASVWATPAIDQATNTIYVGTGNGDAQDASTGQYATAILAMDATTLEIKAHFFLPLKPTDVDIDFGASPTLFQTPDGKQYVSDNAKDGVMYVLNRSDLSLAWKYKLATDCVAPEKGCGSVSSAAFDGRILYVGAGQTDAENGPPGQVYAIDPVTQNPIWVYAARGIVLGPVTVTPGVVYVPTTMGLAILDSATGVELWNDGSNGSGIYGQVAISNGVIYSAYDNGDVIARVLPVSSGPATLVAVPHTLKFGYTTAGSQPAAQPIRVYASLGSLDFTASSDSAWIHIDQVSGTTPLTINVSVDISGMAPNTYTGNLTIRSNDGSSTLTVPVTVIVNGPLPAMTGANIANAASFVPGPMAPGSLFTISAAGLAGETLSAPSVPWPTVLSGLSVTFNGIDAPLAYVSPTQINGQVPYEVPMDQVQVVLHSNGAQSAPITVTIAPTAPSIFLIGGTWAAVVNQDGSINSANNPAPPGSFISLFFTGQGQVDTEVGTGESAPFQTLSNTLADTSATVGGAPASVLYSGLAPRFVGLAQANVQVPAMDPGVYPITLIVGDSTSNSALIAVGGTLQ